MLTRVCEEIGSNDPITFLETIQSVGYSYKRGADYGGLNGR